MPSALNKYASLVKFSHTVFAMPYALIAYVYAITSTSAEFDWLLLVKILFCMVLARNTAMGFNRWADRKIDASNPRTANREIPSGQISPAAAMVFTILNGVGFLAVAAVINHLTLLLAPVALVIIMGYSFTKRFTAWSHIVLGTALAVAPAGAYIAVCGTLDVMPIILAGLVITWVGGFDILYSLQDETFDREHGLKSVPAKYSAAGAKWISVILHLITVYAVALIGIYYGYGHIYWIGATLFIGLLVFQHIIFMPAKVHRIAASFGIVNGISSITYSIFFIAELLGA